MYGERPRTYPSNNNSNPSQGGDNRQAWTGRPGDSAGDYQAANGTKQVNVNRREQAQGFQINISPNVAWGDGNKQCQANQDQGQFNYQGNSDS